LNWSAQTTPDQRNSPIGGSGTGVRPAPNSTNHSALFISQILRLKGLFANLSFFFMPGPAIWNVLPQK